MIPKRKTKKDKLFSLIMIMMIMLSILNVIMLTVSVNLMMDLYNNINNFNDKIPNSILNIIPSENVTITKNQIIIDFSNAEKIMFEPTGSMIPVISENATGIAYKPEKKDLIIGDIVSYTNDDGITIIHRIVAIKVNETDTYYTFKGDACYFNDTESVTFDKIKHKLVTIIY